MTTLVLLHAFPLDAAMYDGVASAFEGDLLTPNLPGFGGEALVEGEPSLDAYAEGVARYLDAKGIERAVIGGTSMGGYTAMAFYRLFPERVAALALIDTKASADAPEAAEGRRTMAQQMVDGQTTDPLVANVLPNLLGATTFATRPDVVTTVEGWVQGADPAAAAWAQLAMAARPDSLQTLAKVSVPSLVVVGSEDVLSPPTDAAAMATVLPAAELVLIPTVGHLTPVEAPEEVTVALNDLMLRVDG